MPNPTPGLRSARVRWAALICLGLVGGAPSGPAAAGDNSAVDRRAVAEVEPAAWSVRPTPARGAAPRSNFSYQVTPNQTIGDSIRVTNFGRAPLPLALYASDARTTPAGVLDLLPAGEQPKDVGRWIALQNTEILVPPGAFLDVPFTLTVPDNAEGGDHTGGIVTSLNTGDPQAGTVRVERRLGNLVQVRVEAALRPGLQITAISAEYRGSANPFGRGEIVATYTVANTGNVRLSAQQAVRVNGPLGLQGRRVFVDPMPELLPGNSLTLTARVPAVTPSIRTSVQVELRPLPVRPGDEFGAEVAAARASAGTWSAPWTLLLLLLLVVLVGPAAAIWWRQRARVRAGVPDEHRVSATPKPPE